MTARPATPGANPGARRVAAVGDCCSELAGPTPAWWHNDEDPETETRATCTVCGGTPARYADVEMTR